MNEGKWNRNRSLIPMQDYYLEKYFIKKAGFSLYGVEGKG